MAMTPQQRAVVEHRGGHAVVSAVAGAGKSTVLAKRIQCMLAEGMDPRTMAVVMFNKDAVLSFEKKLRRFVPDGPIPKVQTLHAMGYRILTALSKSGVLPTYTLESREFIAEVMASNALKQAWKAATSGYPPSEAVDGFREFIALMKSQMVGAAEFFGLRSYPAQFRPFIDAFELFEQEREARRIVFFDDMIRIPVIAMLRDPSLARPFQAFDEIMIDEVQDISDAQFAMLRFIAGDRANVVAVGDVDQSIYAWRGANPAVLGRAIAEVFKPCTHYPMTRTFRFGHATALAANYLISRNTDREEKITVALDSSPRTRIVHLPAEGGVIGVAPIAQKLIAEGRINRAVCLVRYFADAVPIELECLRHGVPFHVEGRAPLIALQEVACQLGILSLATGRWPMGEESISRQVRSMLTYPSLFLPTAELERLTRDIVALISAGDLGLIDKPFQRLITHLQTERPSAIQAVRARMEAFQRLASGAWSMLTPAVILASYHAYIGLREAVTRSLASLEKTRESLSMVDAVMHVAKQHQSTRELLETLAGLATADNGDAPTSPHLRILSIHRAKGLEFGTVFYAGLVQPKPHPNIDQAWIEEERRLAYVAITRAIHELYLCHPKDRSLEDHQARIDAPITGAASEGTAHQHVYDAELGVVERLVRYLHEGEGGALKVRNGSIARAYLAEVASDRGQPIKDITVADVQFARPSPASARAAPQTGPSKHYGPVVDGLRLAPGALLYHPRHGEAKVQSYVYGDIYQLQTEAGAIISESVRSGLGWMRPLP